MKKTNGLILSLFVAGLLALAGCASTPPDQAAAPVETRDLGKPAPRPDPGTGVTKPEGPIVIKPEASTGVDPRLKTGLLGQRSVYFEFDRYDVNEKYRQMLQAHAQYLSQNGSAKMMIQGNTDERGSREYNLALGQRRAEAVKRMLLLMGGRDAQIETVSFGEEKPKRSGSTEEAYAENRRADILYAGE